ncbi:carbohydrate ABC transporter permease [Cohnella silvisoli]|uniref:Sugar ABC transporter permease n=1 Tax=Cohnella silvisoli TaxID=2873699 RepID=A0ABV1KMK0_9BACL|nr:sugar ABC transporter permease [Cohnella silvisoli]MCD9020371.1 sugar ABC transporter permease [Cohnella silvisoli]
MRTKGRGAIWPIVAVTPALLLYAVFVLFPSIGNIYFSFTDFNGNVHKPIHWVGLDNYTRAFTWESEGLWHSIKVTFIFAVLVTFIQNAAAVIVAVFLNMKIRLRNFYRSVIFAPTILGVVVVGLIWTLILDPYSGPLIRIVQFFGGNSALLGSPDTALYLVVFVTIWSSLGYAMILYLAGLQGIPEHLYESAKIDGANARASFFHITLPMLRPSITVNVLLSIIGTLKTFDIIVVMTNGGPGTATTTLGMHIFKNLLTPGSSQGYAAALSIIHFVIVLAVVLIVQTYLQRKEADL